MRIEEVEELVEEVKTMIDEAHNQGITDGHPMARARKPGEIRDYVGYDEFIERWSNALRAEAWHPIEKADELGVKDGRDVMIRFFSWDKHLIRVAKWDSIVKGWLIHGDFCINDGVTHFRFINSPEGA